MSYESQKWTHHERIEAQCIGGGTWIQRCNQIPYLNFTIIGATDNALRIEADAAHQLFMTLQHA